MSARLKQLLGSVLLFGATACITIYSDDGGAWIDEPPPAAQIESIPAPMPGYAWIPGYWDLAGGGWIWVPGRLVSLTVASSWIPPRCQTRGDRHWFTPGRWAHERRSNRPKAAHTPATTTASAPQSWSRPKSATARLTPPPAPIRPGLGVIGNAVVIPPAKPTLQPTTSTPPTIPPSLLKKQTRKPGK